jgi:two-component system response regulator NreC
MAKMKILVVEDQTMIREMLVAACQAAFSLTEVEQAASGAIALQLCNSSHPDLLILDLELPDCDGIDLVPELRKLTPRVKIVALSAHTDEVTVHRVLQAEIEGFIDKNSQPLRILGEAVQTIIEGRRYLSPIVREVWKRLRNEPAAFNKILTQREQEILTQVGLGLTNSEIAERLHLRVVTIQNHRCNILAKLGMHSTSHLIRYANEKGFTRLGSSSHEKR